MALEDQQRPPVVFISYSHDSPEHADRVLALSDRLREHGIDCILDQYEESPPEGWQKWMDRNVYDASFVLMICTERYHKRVMDEEEPGVGQGVRWESTLIYQHIYNADAKNTRFIPVLFEGGQVSHIPTPLQSATHYCVDAKGGYEQLYRHLTSQPSVRKPELGKLKKLEPVRSRERKQDFASVAQGQWPGVSLPRGGPKVSEPFAGREEELKELAAAMSGHKKIVAVVGMAGQGKSCLVGEWYKRGAARPPQGVGLFWRKVYEAGYTFDRFLDELHFYLAGEPIDGMQVRTVRERATVAENLLADKACWIVLDGVERWFKLWVKDPDADGKDATSDDRAGCDSVLDEFLKGACFWENGSRLLLTTRAVPSALDENPPAMIGHQHGHEKRLTDLKPREAIGLLDDLDAKGTEAAKREAVSAYGCHAFAVHVLGALIRDRYGGDASRWREVNPLGEARLGGLFARIVETREEDVPLLELVACSLGPAPVEMLAELTARDEVSVRKSLAGLKKWQMVEFEGAEAEQHTVVRQFLITRMGPEAANARRKQIAAWWAQRPTPVNPTKIDEVRPLLRAVEHLAAARDPDAGADIFLTKPFPESYYFVDEWLRAFGYLDEDIRIHGLVIEEYVDLVEQEGRRELRNDLAIHYNNRGNALADQGHLTEAIEDYGRAIEITETLVQHEGRRDLRNNLETWYNNRGLALADQGHLTEAIEDYGRAIEITQALVEGGDGRDLRNDLARCYNNRGLALHDQGHLADAVEDHGRAIEIYETLVEAEGRRELRNGLALCYNNRGFALDDQGHLAKAIEDYGRAIDIYETLVEREGRRELRNDLAMCYNNRGNVLRAQGHLAEAIEDYERAIDIRETLVGREERRELRNELARGYNNRGLALADQGDLAEAIADYGRAIAIREGLVEREGRRELRRDLEICVFNRAVTRSQMGEWQQAGADVEKGTALLRALVEEGQRHVLGSLLQALGFRCRHAEELGDPAQAAQGANEAMRWFLEEVEQSRMTPPLLEAATGFAEDVRGNRKFLVKHGLDEALWRRFQSSLGAVTGDSPPAET